MTTKEAIKNEPYLNINNICDLADIETAFNELKRIEEKHGESLIICKKYLQIVRKEEIIKRKAL